MQELYLIRHGQAGSRTDYDRLSELGHRQAQLLSKWFEEQGIQFDQVMSGDLRRQKETAAALSRDTVSNPQWNEFDLDAVYGCVAPQLSVIDENFRAEYEVMLQAVADPDNAIHRRWLSSDFALVQAWVAGRFEVECETWLGFYQRILGALDSLESYSDAQRIAIVTSATPIGISTAKLFEAPVPKVFELAGSLHNSSFTVFRRRQTGWSLAGFNHTPHLGEEKLRTMR